MMALWIFVGVFAVVALGLIMWLIGAYNKLVRLRVDCDNGWSQIDVQLKRRYDLIPNLVETVKGYAGHEKETLDAVISARAKAVQTHDSASAGTAQMGRAEGELTQALGRLMVVAEAYPDLKANTNFMQLQEELTSTENKIGFSRQHYNDTVGRYETARQSFPVNIIAGMFNFDKRDYFEIEEPAAREAPKVSFS
ncbi:MAG TPA: LemA family protein [Phycisphaerales bacterium]|nr:LemA family protein [Phycisphaerales bacterium]